MSRVAVQPRARVALAYCLLGIWCAFTLFCLLWILVTSLKSNRELFQNVWSVPVRLHVENYLKIWNTFELRTYFRNSILIVPASVILILVLAAPAAYVLCRARFRGRELLLNFFTFGMGIPFVVLLIPLYVLLTRLRLINSLGGLVIVYVSLSLPFTIFVLSGFFRSFPSQLEEAAAIDGCSALQSFRTIVIPLSSPGLITVSIFNFIGIWNEYLLALILLKGEQRRPLSLGLYSIQSSMQYTGDWVALFAGVVIVLIPLFAFYVLMSERIIEGLTLGALKG
jgi:raffinose/stachyose/melibiose transport system permease protein/N-acetylglucosamine transport system permease protein